MQLGPQWNYGFHDPGSFDHSLGVFAERIKDSLKAELQPVTAFSLGLQIQFSWTVSPVRN